MIFLSSAADRQGKYCECCQSADSTLLGLTFPSIYGAAHAQYTHWLCEMCFEGKLSGARKAAYHPEWIAARDRSLLPWPIRFAAWWRKILCSGEAHA